MRFPPTQLPKKKIIRRKTWASLGNPAVAQAGPLIVLAKRQDDAGVVGEGAAIFLGYRVDKRYGDLGFPSNKYAAYRGPQYDGSSLISAKSYYENFKLRYPEDAKELKVDDILTKINEQLAEKNLRIARYYARTGNPGPANMYNQMILDNWPNTKAAESAREAIGKKN